MSLPPGFMDELKTRVSLGHVAGRKVSWDNRKSNQAKGDLWAPCPFHQEKTASFHVDDQKGFYYCFGCHEKGDIFSFVQQTENLSFMEAVESLAREAGMELPKRDPQAQAKADRRTELAEVMEQAVKFFRLQLKTGAGSAARDYLAGRGLSEAALERWEIGFAPPGWQNLSDHLKGKGVAAQALLDTGLTRESTKGKEPYDVFRDRIMFPIRDARGRAIAFGGRAMDPGDNAKYLNSPETILFDKGRNLYNQRAAREAAGKGKPLIVAEGYMDVIALSEAGFGATVAPLGTAITPEQLHLLWRIADEPIVALDGDKAGVRAALRLVDLALPLIEAGKSLRFCLMPEGLDPDDLVRAEGAGAMQKLLDRAVPMVELLWRRETEGKTFDSPERKAALDRSLRESIRVIRDDSLRRHYGDEVNRRRRALFDGQRMAGRAPQRGGGPRVFRPGGGRWQPPATPMMETKASAFAGAGETTVDEIREAVILATLVTHPDLVPDFVAELERLETNRPEHETLRLALIETGGAEAGKIEEICGANVLETVLHNPHVPNARAIAMASADKASMQIAEALAKLSARRGARREIDEALAEVDVADEGLTWRLSQAAEALRGADQGVGEDRTEYETGPNGSRLSKDERSAFDALIGRIDFSKRGRGGQS